MKRFGSIMARALLSSTAMTGSYAAYAGEAAQAPAAPVEEIVVRGAFIPEPKRVTSEILSYISPEDLQRQGDSNIALSLRRVTGLSLVGGKFIYIRGLGERYSNALLNGLPLPSPEPLRRVVPLDLFPTAVIESASAQKTYSPQYSGEFGGGLLEIKTKAVPDSRFIDVGISVGGNTETTWRKGLLYEGGAYDWTGFDSGTRAIPVPLQDAIDSGNRINSLNFTDIELQRIGRSLVNSDLWVVFEGTTPGDISFDVTYGDRFLRGDTSIGLITSFGYDNSWQTKRGQQQDGRFGTDVAGNKQLTVSDDFNFISTQNDLSLHGMLGLGAEWGDSSVKFTSLYIRNTTKEARTQEGISAQFGSTARRDYTEWFERQMWTNQIDGTHVMDNFTVNWRGSYSTASRNAPYERFVQYRDFGSGQLSYDFSQGRNLTRFSNIDDTLLAGALDLTYVSNIANREVTWKGGYLYTDNDRDSAQRDYRLQPTGGPLPPQLLFSRIDYIFSDQNINPGRFVLTEVTGSAAPPAYTGALEIHGTYLGFDAQAADFVRIAFGGRYESGKQVVDTFDFYTPNTGIETQIKKDYWLPAGTVTWNFAENMQVRLGASKTIGRPQFRELAPADFIDVDTDRQFVGNPFLINSQITNYDGRFEWYFADQQNVTLGGFYKKLRNPIEETINEAGDNQQTTFQNVPRAKVWGVEVEAKYIFQTPFTEQSWLSTKDFTVAANYTFSESEISIKPDDVVIRQNGTVLPASFLIQDGRPLQGHSRHLLNFQVGYDDIENNEAATLLVNFASRRIRATAPQTLPEIYERPPISLDFTYSRSFNVFAGEYEFGFKAENILGSRYEATQEFGGVKINVDTYKLGRSFSLSLKRHF
jgi:outer membrane receptor protein involved in Fe transport